MIILNATGFAVPEEHYTGMMMRVEVVVTLVVIGQVLEDAPVVAGSI